MMRITSLLLLLVASCQLPTEVRPFAQGMQRSNLEASFLSTETSDEFGGEADEDSLSLAVSHGSFLSPNVELGGELAYFSSDYSDNFGNTGEADGFALGGYGRYYFVSDASMRPFAELAIGFGSTDYGGGLDGDLTLVSLGVGSMQMLSDHTALEFILRYVAATTDFDGFELEQDTLSLFVGYSVFL